MAIKSFGNTFTKNNQDIYTEDKSKTVSNYFQKINCVKCEHSHEHNPVNQWTDCYRTNPTHKKVSG